MSTSDNFSATFVSDLEPTTLWRHFDHILAIPRGSRNEEGMRQYVRGVAAQHGLTAATDAAGNVVVKVPSSPGREGAAPLALQSHLDMVCEKNSEVTFDFTVGRDPAATGGRLSPRHRHDARRGQRYRRGGDAGGHGGA